MSRPPPQSARSLDARLRNLARNDEIAEGRLRRTIAIAVIGQLLGRTEAGVIKGASNLEIRVGTRATRVSSDLDAVRRQTLEEFRDGIAEALREGWGDFTGVLVDEGEIAIPAPGGYRPHRFRVKLQFRTRNFGSVTVEVAPQEVGAREDVDYVVMSDAQVWFAELGLPFPDPIPALPLKHQIAQKLHACTSPDTDDWINDRVHDLVDLQLAMRLFDGSLADIRSVATRLFVARRQHAWPPLVTLREGWDHRYAAEAEALDVLERLDDAIAWANEFIARIEAT